MSGAGGNMVLGAVNFSPARSCEDSMAQSIIRIQEELEEAQAQIAVYQVERSILQKRIAELEARQ